jgi:predicted  nucleic acid-binding Zn-ribbon protein
MKDERLLALIDLQSIITRKYNLYREHEAIPGRLDQLRSQIAEAEAKLEAAQKAVADNQQSITRSHKDIQFTQEKLTTVQAKLNQVKTTREYESRQKEIKQQRDHLSDAGKYVVEAEAKTAALEVESANAQQELDALNARLRDEIEELEKASAVYEEQLETILSEELEKKQPIPSDILSRVEKLVLLRGGLAVVPVHEGCCGGCGIHLSPQMIQVAKRGLDLMQCDRCSSYLYWDGEED